MGGRPFLSGRFKIFSEDTNPNFIAEGFTTELAIELARYQDIQSSDETLRI